MLKYCTKFHLKYSKIVNRGGGHTPSLLSPPRTVVLNNVQPPVEDRRLCSQPISVGVNKGTKSTMSDSWLWWSMCYLKVIGNRPKMSLKSQQSCKSPLTCLKYYLDFWTWHECHKQFKLKQGVISHKFNNSATKILSHGQKSHSWIRMSGYTNSH